MASWMVRLRGWIQGAAQPLGLQGEELAAQFLLRERYTLIGRNVYIGRYEIDLIARDGDTTVFVEVKTRRDETWAEPIRNVDARKRRKLCTAARQYAAMENNPEMYYRFDVVAVVIPEAGSPRVTVYRDAFKAG